MTTASRYWIGSGGSIFEVAGNPTTSPARTTLGRLLERKLRERPVTAKPRPAAPEPDPAAALEAELRQTAEGRQLLAEIKDAAGEALDLETRALTVDLLRNRLLSLERQLECEFQSPPAYRCDRAVYTLTAEEIPKARRELAAAQHVLDRARAERALKLEACARRPAA